ncbi:copper chaperone PCu(A)C [Devosia rhizoryzae]|uniref:Copper chaperone PCu(A)C n=1 Tax=Devosia rhizoryzae TaxID=2774137 RepID=A0ABX7C715_9HYPH|nr:copper chaperone PCu(A)C [Devosia rhizoryzae]QQR40057.1 copper chaperone PCu(A)C [Devosia rhizoryzae]
MKTLLTTLLLLGPAIPAAAHEFTVGDLYVDHPMIEEAPPNAPVLGGYLSIANRGGSDDRLVAIESAAARKVELHRSSVTDGIARMQQITDGLAVPAGTTVELGDGNHAMFLDPDRRYVAGDEIGATLVFENAGRVDVVFEVEKRSAESAASSHGDHAR